MALWKIAARPALVSEGARALGVGASLHTSSSRSAEHWSIPDRLKDIPTAANPSFFNMVEYYFHKACVVAEPTLMESLKRMRISEEAKRKKVQNTQTFHNLDSSLIFLGPWHSQNHRTLRPRPGGEHPPPEGRRDVRDDHRVQGSALPPQDPVQGRHQVLDRRQCRRGQGLGRAHDLQVRLRRRPLRRRKGWPLPRPQEVHGGRDGARDATLRHRAGQEGLPWTWD